MHEDRRSEPFNFLLTNRKKRFIQLHHNKFLIDQQQALVAGSQRNIEHVPNDHLWDTSTVRSSHWIQ